MGDGFQLFNCRASSIGERRDEVKGLIKMCFNRG